MQNLEHGTLVHFLLSRDYSAEKAAEEIESGREAVGDPLPWNQD